MYVSPKAGSDRVDGWRGDELAVKVTAPPEGGKANAATCKLVARALSIPKSGVTVVRGHSSRHKLLHVGAEPDAVRKVFGVPE